MLKRLLVTGINGLLALAAVLLFFIMFLTTFDVIGRYVFNSPIDGTYEITELVMGVFSPIAIMYCAWEKNHISVDIVFEKLPGWLQALVTSMVTVIELAVACLLTYESYLLVGEIIDNGTSTPILDLSYWPIACMIALSFLFMVIIYLFHFVEANLKKQGGER